MKKVKKILRKAGDIIEKVMDFAAYTFEVAIIAVDATPEELDKLIDDRLRKLLGMEKDKKKKKPKTKTKRRNTPSKAQIYKELGEQDDAIVEIAASFRESTKEEKQLKIRFMKRILELKRIDDMQAIKDIQAIDKGLDVER